MYLKSLTLRGFKSFADKTQMVFDPGLTVVVGPNGSGKSNISDAILWVLGEQSAKMLRGSAMEDVIFSGSSARGSVNMAEVTLVLDNSDQTLPVDFTEVAVTRRMYRSGENEYLINNAACRLMDVTEILHDSGLGREMHSIISQGNLDSILSSRPEERRELIEEAAGISKHRRRKARSERKLKSMDENLKRAKDIQREIVRQLKPLERQVGKARQAQELNRKYSEVSLVLAVDDVRRLRVRHDEVSGRAKEAEAATSLARLRLDEKSGELERYQSLLEEKGLYVGDLGQQRSRVNQLLADVASERRLLEQKAAAGNRRIAELSSTAKTATSELESGTAELERVQADLTGARAEWDELKRQTDEAAAEQRKAKGLRQDLGRRLADAQAKLRAAQREADNETLSFAKLSEQVGNAQVEDELFRSRLNEISQTIDTCSEAIGERENKKKQVEADLARTREAAQEAKEAVGKLNGEIKEARAAEQRARDALSRRRGELAALESRDAASERTSALVAALMKRNSAKRVECRLADLIDAPAELDRTIELLLGSDIASLVVADAQAATAVAADALSLANTKGAATVVRRDVAAKGFEEGEGVCGRALVDDIRITEGAEALVGALLGGVRIVGSVEEAISAHDRYPDLTFVTKDGCRALPDGRLLLGESADTELGALERKRRIREMKQEIPELERAQMAATSKVGELERQITAKREAEAKASGDVARLRGEISSITSEMGRLEAQRSQAVAERGRVERQRAEAEAKAADAREKIVRHKQAADEAEARARELADMVDELSDERSQASHAESDADRRLSDVRLRLATVQERKNNLIVREGDLKGRISRLTRSSETSTTELLQARAKQVRYEPLKSRLKEFEDGLVAWQLKLADRASLAEADSAELKQTIGGARSAVEDARSALEKAQSAAADARVELGRLDVMVEQAVAAIDSMGYDLAQALKTPEPEDREAAEAEKAKLAAQIQRMGPVNEVAMEEYEKLKVRSDYITEQVQDLEASVKSLNKISAAIERKMRTQFLEVFELVNANFQEIFALLFPGGKAHLEMTEAENVFECGIEIQAQPKGKRIQKMMLMSGGEKSLTALALLFAVYRTRTVPFYVFDEVEAALDDANLGKLLTAIEELRKTTQLIVISHQRRTMEQADVLYGVSMQADGVSHVVSQRLDQSGRMVNA